LAVEVKNFARITFLSFNTTAVFLHDVMVPEHDFLNRGNAVGVFSWVTLSSDYRFWTASSVDESQPIGNVVFVKSPSTVYFKNWQSWKVISTRKV